jgi:hypothetical protein
VRYGSIPYPSFGQVRPVLFLLANFAFPKLIAYLRNKTDAVASSSKVMVEFLKLKSQGSPSPYHLTRGFKRGPSTKALLERVFITLCLGIEAMRLCFVYCMKS